MRKHLNHKLPNWWRCTCRLFLALSWCAGLFLGILAASAASETLVPLMRGTVTAPVSIFGLLAVIFLPFLFSAYAVYFAEPWLLLIVSIFKAFSFAFCSFGLCLAFGQCSWLVRFLYLFSDVFSIPVLYCFWLRNISGRTRSSRRECIVFGIITLVIGCIDYWLISPFLTSLQLR